jgi:carbon-monoxide dehydrogenase medium subunit
VKPAAFEYHAPERLDEMLTLLADDEREARVLAGGQSLVPMMNFRLAVPEVLVDLRRVDELRRIGEAADGALEVGAAVTQAAVLGHPRARAGWPVLCEAIRHVGHPQIRSRGTLCGSLAHHDPHGELPALAVALGATMVVAGTAGTREVAAEDFFVSYYEVALEPGEMLVQARFPALPAGSGWSFREIARRRGDFALVGVVCVLAPGDPRLVVFGAADRPLRMTAAEQDPDDAARLVADNVQPLDDLHASASYRREAAADLATAAVTEARERTGA